MTYSSLSEDEIAKRFKNALTPSALPWRIDHVMRSGEAVIKGEDNTLVCSCHVSNARMICDAVNKSADVKADAEKLRELTDEARHICEAFRQCAEVFEAGEKRCREIMQELTGKGNEVAE